MTFWNLPWPWEKPEDAEREMSHGKIPVYTPTVGLGKIFMYIWCFYYFDNKIIELIDWFLDISRIRKVRWYT